ncbi:MAG: RbsD/FucU domain-containing protein [Planctomycetota bacterium]
MLKLPVLHPEILSSLGRAGHLSTVLISDGNYPHTTKPRPGVDVVWANYRPGLLDGNTVLEMLCDLIPIEAATVMAPNLEGEFTMDHDPPIWVTYKKTLAGRADFHKDLVQLQKPEFNALAEKPDLALVIATGEQAIYANLLLTIGVITDEVG